MHGFGIARRVEQISRGVFKVNPGSLLTALQRLERAGWLTRISRVAYWGQDAVLAKNRLQELNVAPSKLTNTTCSFKLCSN